MFDISLETVRDFGKYFFSTKTTSDLGINTHFDFAKINPDTLEKESASLLDNSNEAIQVRGLTKLELKSPSHFAKIMEEEEHFRTQLDSKQKISNKRYHQVYVLQLKHKMSA